jgi:hypothetical protein
MKKIFLLAAIALLLNVIAFMVFFLSLIYLTGIYRGIVSFFILPPTIAIVTIIEIVCAFDFLFRRGMKEVGQAMFIAIGITLLLFYLLIQLS